MADALSILDITVVFSSYNGAKRLPKTLDSFARQDLPHDRWELLAVDNNSADDTFAVMQSYVGRLPIAPFRHLTPGKSSAINAATGRARGRLIVFTDDDVEAEADWLSAIVACAGANPEYAIFGGRIVPDWERLPVGQKFLQWIPLGSTYAVIDETVSGPCEPTKVWGPNTTIRRDSLGSIRYREDIGPVPGPIYAMGEDQDIVMRLAARGARCYRCAEAVVHHFVPASNLTETWVQQRAERLGYGVPALFPDRVPSGPRVAGVPIGTWIESASWTVRAAILSLRPESKQRFWAVWKRWYMRGFRQGVRRYASGGQPQNGSF
jgi:GT2 family glycosyltransferase